MNDSNKRIEKKNGKKRKGAKRECEHGDDCPRVSPSHLKDFSHPHLESILDNYSGEGAYPIPNRLRSQRELIMKQIQVIVNKQLYTPVNEVVKEENSQTQSPEESENDSSRNMPSTSRSASNGGQMNEERVENEESEMNRKKRTLSQTKRSSQRGQPNVAPPPDMAAKHAASAPYYIFYTKITDSPETHDMPNSITFPEILDPSLGDLECSLQITFLLNLKWLYEQYNSAGYGNKNLTILYGDEQEIETVNKRNIETIKILEKRQYNTHHTKMMLLCYEDGSMRVVVATANLYPDDWRNRTQGVWLGPKCLPLPADAAPEAGESPTMFKKSLLDYLEHYDLTQLNYYISRVESCDFSHINVFLVASTPGTHKDTKWGLTRAGTLLDEHCFVPAEENSNWPLIAQATSIGSLRIGPEEWLTGAFLKNLTNIRDEPEAESPPAELKLIYPSKENVAQSHDGQSGGDCLSYSQDNHAKQPWLTDFLHQWRAVSTYRDRSMPHIKSYLRVSPDNKMAAFFLLTSANVSKAAWGSVNKGNKALYVMNYEAGVLFLPKFVINEDLFPLEEGAENRLVLPYDVPPVKYTEAMSPWISTNKYRYR